MQLRGTLTRVTVKKNVSGDTVQTIIFEVHGDISSLYNYLDSPLAIDVMPE